MKVAFAGLGVMGFPMAGYLAKAGHDVTVYNRSPEKAQRWVETYGGRAAATVAEAAEGVEIFALCVGADKDIREVVGEALPVMSPGSVVVDHTTASAVVARDMAELAAQHGCTFVDAPVSGGQSGAEAGKLTIMCGGDPKDFARVEPVINVYAKAVRLMGPVGAGQLTKMCNQICIAGVVQGLAEAMHFAEHAGLDPVAVYDPISKGAAGSWQLDNRWQTMSEDKFDYGFAVDWMVKDLGLLLEEAGRNGAKLEMTEMVQGVYREVQAMGGGRWDTSSLVKRLRK
jgi:3-hydroxyisobutyrate dehydrogenase